MDKQPYKFDDCIYYDCELRELSRHFEEIYKIFKDIKKRADRRQTVQISKSVFDYYEKKKALGVTPQQFYDFRYGSYRICIFRYRSKFSVLCVGFDYPNHDREDIYWIGPGFLYGRFSNINDAVKLYTEIVFWFSMTLFPVDDIPF